MNRIEYSPDMCTIAVDFECELEMAIAKARSRLIRKGFEILSIETNLTRARIWYY